jgi:hypothetical protein
MLFSLRVVLIAAAADLPPRPTPAPAPTSVPSPGAAGAYLVLHAAFPEDWDFVEVHWRTPVTLVQWQDAHGTWHDVEGWRGTLDHVSVKGGAVTGWKRWWVAPQDFGSGPFRWIVHEPCGALLATSAPFSLPVSSGARQVVDVTMEAGRTQTVCTQR